MQVSATYEGDHLTVTFTGWQVNDSHGQGSIDDIDVDAITIMGHDLPYGSWPKGMAKDLLDLADDLEFS